jgi:tetratricopeptide (TPR) repeat protein
VNYCQEEGTVLAGIITLKDSGGIPIKGVTITARGANPAVSKNSGLFEMQFIGKKPGDRVILSVYKKGLEVVNSNELEVRLRSDPDDLVKIVMCKEGERDENALIYYKIAAKNINENYEKRLQEIKAQSASDTNKIIAELKAHRDVALSWAKKLAEKFARVNLDDAHELYKTAFDYFKQGNIEKALKVLDDAKIENDIRIAREAKQKLEEYIKKCAKNFVLKAQFYITKFKFDEAETYFQKAIQADPDNFESNAIYAYFLYYQNKFSKSLPEYEKALSLAETDNQKAAIHNRLGNLYIETARFDKALEAFTQALDLRRKLANANRTEYLPDVARTLCDMGAVYSDIYRTDEALAKYKKALNIYKELQKKKPNAYLADEAFTLNRLGILYLDIPDFVSTTEPLKVFKKALQNYEKLAAENQDIDYYSAYEAMVLTNLGKYYVLNELFKDAEKAYNKALTIRIKLAEKNPNNLPYVAHIRVNLGLLYCYIDNCGKTEENYNKALKIYRELADENPNAYNQEVAWTLCHLGNFYRLTSRFSEASDAYKEALDIREQLAKENPENPTAFELDITSTLILMCYLCQDRIDKGNEESCKKKGLRLAKRAITILETILERDPDVPKAKSNMEKARELLEYFEM